MFGYIRQRETIAQSWGPWGVPCGGELPRIGSVAFVFPFQQPRSMEGMDHDSPQERELTCEIVVHCLHNLRNFNFVQCLCEMVEKCYQTPIIFIISAMGG